jgi:mono/diheme cytochrome c family protein
MHSFLRYSLAVGGLLALSLRAGPLDKPTYHNDAQRTGWNAHETELTPRNVSGATFGQLWQTPQLDSVDGQPPRLFATPLYVDRVAMAAGRYPAGTYSVIYAASDVGYLYAINAASAGDVPPGAILWRRRLSDTMPGGNGAIATPTIDLLRQRIYAISAEGNQPYRVHVLDLRSGEPASGWPVVIDAAAVNAPGINRNGTTRFPAGQLIQRAALNLSPDGSRLYVAFAEGASAGWIVALDARAAAVATAFASTARSDEVQGGMWASGGPSVDAEGFVHIATGSSVQVYLKKKGLPGIFPDSEHNWGQSVIRLRDNPKQGFELVGTYTPFNFAEAQVMDIDLGSSGTTVIDLDPATTATPHLLVIGGKQGNIYLLDRAHLPGSLVKRPAISNDSATDGSLLSPDIQPQFGKRGPINLFGPYADKNAMNDQARSRTTQTYFRSAEGKNYVFVTGSAKTGPKLDVSTPPGLARLEIVTAQGRPAFLKIDQLEGTQTFHNPGSPVVTSNGGRDAIIWVLDSNAPRTTPLVGPNAPRPVLYAFDALTFELLWKSAPGELATSGKYNEATVVRGLAIVGTDRIQAFGRQTVPPSARPVFPPVFAAAAVSAPKRVVDLALAQVGKAVFDVRCVVCHNSGQPGIPPVATISRLDSVKVVETLRNGIMKPQATGLTERDFGAIAAYLGSLPLTTATPDPEPAQRVSVSGRALYVRHCILCHMPNGSGVPSLQPALRDNAVVRGDPAALVRAVLRGSDKSGSGATHNFSSALSDPEAAALLTYVRQAFGLVGTELRAEEIAAGRQR